MCTNTQSGVNCSCHNGYQLISGKSCKGKHALIVLAVTIISRYYFYRY